MDAKLLVEDLWRNLDKHQPVALATVITVAGSAPARPGAKMLVFPGGNISGTVGGGAVEAKVIEDALQALHRQEAVYNTYNLTSKEAAGLGMICGGEMTVFIDVLGSGPELVLLGAGHISQHLAPLAKGLDFMVTVMDDREEFASPERFPEADRLIVEDIPQVLDHLTITEHTYLAILTRGHKHDQVALEKVLSSGAAYIGMVGSRNKIKTIYDNMKQKGFSEACLNQVYAPIGLNLGGSSPAEIALSIAAELVQVRYGKAQKGCREKHD